MNINYVEFVDIMTVGVKTWVGLYYVGGQYMFKTDNIHLQLKKD